MNWLKEFWNEEDAVGIVEIVLILVVLIAIVLLFKEEIGKIITKAFKTATKDSGDIIE